MAQIEFKNLETEKFCQKFLYEMDQEQLKEIARTQAIRRGLVLVKAGLYWGGIE